MSHAPENLVGAHAIELTTNEHKSALAGLRRWQKSPGFASNSIYACENKTAASHRKIQHPFIRMRCWPCCCTGWLTHRLKRSGQAHSWSPAQEEIELSCSWSCSSCRMRFDRQHMGQRKPGHTEQGIGRYFRFVVRMMATDKLMARRSVPASRSLGSRIDLVQHNQISRQSVHRQWCRRSDVENWRHRRLSLNSSSTRVSNSVSARND